jgi:hypothetical protein
MACLLGVQRSLGKAEVALLEVAGCDLDDNTIRRLCHATAARADAGRGRRADTEAFARQIEAVCACYLAARDGTRRTGSTPSAWAR